MWVPSCLVSSHDPLLFSDCIELDGMPGGERRWATVGDGASAALLVSVDCRMLDSVSDESHQ